MAAEVKLQPGWLRRDVQKAVERLGQWSKSQERPSPANVPKRQGSSNSETNMSGKAKGESN